MNELYTFYKDVLGKLDFSITSYNFVEQKIDNFFNELCESPVFIGRNHIDFISFAFAKLKDPIDFNVKNLTEQRIFFNSFNERSLELLLMNDYYNFKHYLSELDSTSTENRFYTAEIVAKLFINGTGFKVLCNDKNHTSVKYDQHIDTISIQIPFHYLLKNPDSNLFKEVKNKTFSHFEEKIGDIDLNSLSIHKFRNIYKHSESTNKDLLSKDLLDDNKIKDLLGILYSKVLLLNTTNEHYFFGEIESGSTKENVLKDFIKLVVSQGFSSFLFGCWIENIPSIVNVDSVSGYRQSLGTIVVGYNEEKELSYDERTYFKFISDRISHILATEALFELSPELRYKRLRKIQVSYLKKFKDNVLSQHNIDHGTNAIADASLSLMNDFFAEITRQEFNNCGLNHFEEFVKEVFKKGEKTDCGLFVEFHAQNGETKSKNLIYDKSDNGNDLKIELKDNHEAKIERPIVNVVFPHFLIKILQENSSNGKPYVKSVKTVTNENRLNIFLCFHSNISLKGFGESLTGNRHQGSGDLGQFLRDYYDAIRIIGNLVICEVIEENGNTKLHPVLDFENDVVAEYTSSKISQLKLNKELEDKQVTKLVYQLHYKSI